jgi:hypothetical protein
MSTPSSSPSPSQPAGAAEAASSSLAPSLSPEDVADNIIYALEVHERQLCQLRKNPAELKQLMYDSVRTLLAGFDKTPGAEERDRFFAIMEALCEREQSGSFE